MTPTTCKGCRYAYTEDWKKDASAVRCGNKANGHYFGRVTAIFPRGRTGCIPEGVPKWCIFTKGERTA